MDTACLQTMQSFGKTLASGGHMLKHGNKPDSTKDGLYDYKTMMASRYPCQCRYSFAGTEKHQFYQFFNGSELGYASGHISKLTVVNDDLNILSSLVDTALMRRFLIPESALPNYAIVNEYQTSSTSIGWHTDADKMFCATEQPAVIFSFNFHRSGVFAVAPMDTSHRADLSATNRSLGEPLLWQGLGYETGLTLKNL